MRMLALSSRHCHAVGSRNGETLLTSPYRVIDRVSPVLPRITIGSHGIVLLITVSLSSFHLHSRALPVWIIIAAMGRRGIPGFQIIFKFFALFFVLFL